MRAPTTPHIRLGFPVRVLGAPGLPSHDSRRWQNRPHLSVSLAYLRDIFHYLDRHGIRFYRMAGQLAPYLTHPGLPHFHNQIEECATALAEVGDLARALRIRLTLHPGFYIQLGSARPEIVARSAIELRRSAALLDAMGLSPDSVIVIHVGGDQRSAFRGRERFVRTLDRIEDRVRRRLVLENDDRCYGLADLLWIHRRSAIPLVLDTLHHRCLDPLDLPLSQALRMTLSTWPTSMRPKIHMSTSRTEMRRFIRRGESYYRLPLPNQHSDFLNPFEVIDLIRSAHSLGLRSFDIMLEAKAQDVALLRLRSQIQRFAPSLHSLIE